MRSFTGFHRNIGFRSLPDRRSPAPRLALALSGRVPWLKFCNSSGLKRPLLTNTPLALWARHSLPPGAELHESNLSKLSCEIIAERIIEAVKRGERDPRRLCSIAIAAIGRG
jgi:hypothetical protein